MAILGISTNTRLLGLAIIDKGKLVHSAMHLYKGPWSLTKANRIVTSLKPCVRQYCIKRVVLSIPLPHYQTVAFQKLLKVLTRYFERVQIPVLSTKSEALYNLIPSTETKSKKAFMQSIVAYYPELTTCYNKEVRNKKRYYIKLFEAIGVLLLEEKRNVH